jgi:hypothetical protein
VVGSTTAVVVGATAELLDVVVVLDTVRSSSPDSTGAGLPPAASATVTPTPASTTATAPAVTAAALCCT